MHQGVIADSAAIIKAHSCASAEESQANDGSFLRHCAGQAELARTIEYIGRPVDTVAITVECPAHVTAHAMTQSSAEVAAEHVYIDIPGCKPLDLALPFAVSAQDAIVQHAKENRQLHIELTLLPCRQLVEQVEAQLLVA